MDAAGSPGPKRRVVRRPAASPGAGSTGGALSGLAVWIVLGLTAIALVLRLLGLHESLFADEVYTYRIVSRNDFLGVIRDVHDTAITPPLHYVLANGAVQLGNPLSWIRVPSIVLGSLTVPVVYLLGTRTVGRPAALVGAAFAAISPFAVFYGTEARAYATLIFLCTLSTLALVIALDTGRRRWLVVYVLAATLALYAHYSGIFVVVAQAGWALAARRDRWRELLLTDVAIALAYAPWIPSFLFQGREHPPDQISLVSPVTLDSFQKALLATFPGRPFVFLHVLPGRVALVLLVAGLAVAVGALALGLRRRGVGVGRPSPQLVLLGILVVATPLGIVVYSLADTSLFGPRNLSASLPAAWLLLGRLLTAPRRVPAVVATALAVTAVGVGTVKALGDQYRRPPYRQAASFVESRSPVCGHVVEALWLNRRNALSRALAPNFAHQHELIRLAPSDVKGWRGAGQGRRVFVVAAQTASLRGRSWGALLGRRFSLVERRRYRGVIGLDVLEYEQPGGVPDARLEHRGKQLVLVGLGPRALPLDSGAGTGYVDAATGINDQLVVSGWALDNRTRRPASRVLVFDRGCLLFAARPTVRRKDVIKLHGSQAARSGFLATPEIAGAGGLARPSQLRVVAVSGDRAWRLPTATSSFHGAR